MTKEVGYNANAQTVYFMYPCDCGYMWAGITHTVEDAIDAYMHHAVKSYRATGLTQWGREAAAEEVARFTYLTAFQALRVYDETMALVIAWYAESETDGTLAALRYHRNIGDYPSAE